MSKELEERVDRLEKALGSFGTDIHEFDSPAQAKAYAKQLESEQADEAKQVAKLQKEADAAAAAPGTSTGTPARRKPAARRKPVARAKPTTLARSTTATTTTALGSGH